MNKRVNNIAKGALAGRTAGAFIYWKKCRWCNKFNFWYEYEDIQHSDSYLLIGKALNRTIYEGDMVHIGASPKRDGLTACERVSVVCTDNPSKVKGEGT